MGGQRRNQLGKGGPRKIQSYFPHKKVMDYTGPQKTKAIWVPSIPSWEKEFCKQSVGLSWKTFCELKKYTTFFPEIENWNDSAAEEAFHLSKKRYISKMKGTPCEIPEVNPSEYIDEVDWNSLRLEDIDWAEEYSSDYENEGNCTGMESLPTLYYDMTTSEKERYEKNKSQWKERPFGYGQIFFPEIQEARTLICKVVDLYTAQPQLLNHWKVDLWSDDFRMPNTCAVKNQFQVSGWGSEFENELKKGVCHSGWGSQFHQENEVIDHSKLGLEFGHEKEEICHSGWDLELQHGNEIKLHSGWGSRFDYDKDLICYSSWGLQFDYDRDIICHSQWSSMFQYNNEAIHHFQWRPQFEHKKEVPCHSGWVSEFEHKKEIPCHSGWVSEFEHKKEVSCHSGWVSRFEHDKKIIRYSSIVPLIFNYNPKKKWRKRNKKKNHRDHKNMNTKCNYKTKPKNDKGRLGAASTVQSNDYHGL